MSLGAGISFCDVIRSVDGSIREMVGSLTAEACGDGGRDGSYCSAAADEVV